MKLNNYYGLYGDFMRKNIILLLLTTLIMITGCNTNNVDTDNLAQEHSEKLLELLSNEDANGIKDMFCDIVSNSSDLDNQINKVMQVFDGKIVSYSTPIIASKEHSEHMKQQEVQFSSTICDVNTDTNNSYTIYFYEYLINEEYPEYIGISEIQIVNNSKEDSMLKVGNYYLVNK